ncbi:transposable element Tcb1 transposase [Trichonephila clavipes]|nr:transposable element Tcb1 transposase [Trichonephila clavipes]
MNFEGYFLGISGQFGGIRLGFEYPIAVLLLHKVSSPNGFPLNFLRPPLVNFVAAVAECYRYRTVACLVTSLSPVPLKTLRVGQRCTLNLLRAETSSRWCGVVVKRGGCQLRCHPRHLTMVQKKIGSRVGRNQTTVMRICYRWMQEGTTDRRGRSHPPQCITSPEDRQIVRMVLTDRSVTSRTIARHIESITHHSVSAHIIRCRLQQSDLSARRPLLSLHLTQNHRRLRCQWCNERRMWVVEGNEVVFTDESRICLQYHDGRIRVWRHRGERMLNSGVMHHHTGPAPGIMVWGGIGYHSRTPLVRIAGTLYSQRFISDVLEPVVLLYL